MTKSSESRNLRRQEKSALPKIPTSVIQFQQLNDQGGFTFNVGLWGTIQAMHNENQVVPVTSVDIMALAVAQLIRTNSKDLQDACATVREMLHKTHEGLAAGKSVEEVLQEAAVSVGAASETENGEANS